MLTCSPRTIKAIWDYLKQRRSPENQVWLSEENRPLAAHGVQEIIRRLAKRAGISGKKLGPHTFRHTYASRFLESGGQEIELQYLLGHNSLTMVERYSRATKAQRALKAQEKFSPVDRLKFR